MDADQTQENNPSSKRPAEQQKRNPRLAVDEGIGERMSERGDESADQRNIEINTGELHEGEEIQLDDGGPEQLDDSESPRSARDDTSSSTTEAPL